MKKYLLAMALVVSLMLTMVSCDDLLNSMDISSLLGDHTDPTEESTGEVTLETQAILETQSPESDPETEAEESLPDETDPDETTPAETTPAETTRPAETQTGMGGEDETEDPEDDLPYVSAKKAGMIYDAYDNFYVNGAPYFAYDGNAGDKLNEIGNRIVFQPGEVCNSVYLRGWIGFQQPIESFGYYVDTYDFVYGNFAQAAEEAVMTYGGQYASRFAIQIDFADLSAGEHRIGFVAKLADGTVALLHSEITVVVKNTQWTDNTIVKHLNFDELIRYSKGVKKDGVFMPGDSDNWDLIANCDASVDSLGYRGWVAVMGELGQFGYSINGGKPVYSDKWNLPTEGAVFDAAAGIGADTATRMEITIPFTNISGEGNKIMILYKNAKGESVILSTFTVNLPEKGAMDPVSVFHAPDLGLKGNASGIRYTEVVRNSFLHVIPGNSDPYYYPFASVQGARYVAIRYRTADATNAHIQFFLASSGSGPSDDSSMLSQPVLTDGEWHLAIFDTQSLIDAGIYNGSYVSYFRFDPLEAGYKLDANGNPYKPDGLVYARYDLPADCSIDVSYIGFFHSVEAAELYDAGVVKDDSAFDGELPDQEPDLGLNYIMNGDNTYSVNHLGSCTASVVVIPSTYNSLPVTRIMPRVFWGYSQVTCFVFPDSIEVIEQDAAPYCTNLKTIYFGKGLKSIGNWAFFQCTSLTDIYYAGSEEEWDRINNGQEWVSTGVTVHFNTVYVP